jgi:antitoxin component YwqK of YwqJK toxin-antitoxin module
MVTNNIIKRLLFLAYTISILSSCCTAKEEYYETGPLDTRIVKYKYGIDLSGEKCGQFVWLSRSGDTLQHSTFRNDKLHGTSRYYFDNGALQLEAECKDDKLHGRTTEYYRNKQIQTQCVYNENRLVKIIFLYDSTGNPLNYGTLKDGNGILINYYPDGTVREKGGFKNGYRHGWWYSYTNTGYLMDSIRYENGFRPGSDVPESHY